MLNGKGGKKMIEKLKIVIKLENTKIAIPKSNYYNSFLLKFVDLFFL